MMKSPPRRLLFFCLRAHYRSFESDSPGNSGAISEIAQLISSISSSRPAFSISRPMACAVNIDERKRWVRQVNWCQCSR